MLNSKLFTHHYMHATKSNVFKSIFQPLLEWLAEENLGEDTTWTDQCPDGVIEN